MKLIELAKTYDCKIVTNDFNLNKVAQLHGVEVLNINELANALSSWSRASTGFEGFPREPDKLHGCSIWERETSA
jgi:predicted DNA-binding protein (UPF0278 family)